MGKIRDLYNETEKIEVRLGLFKPALVRTIQETGIKNTLYFIVTEEVYLLPKSVTSVSFIDSLIVEA